MDLLIKPLSDKIGTVIPYPYYATSGAAAMDLHACIDEDVVIPARGRVLIPTGIAAAIPEGYVGLNFARSGMAAKRGLAPANKVGVIDSDYRGELMVALHNHGNEPQTVEHGDRVAQICFVPYIKAAFDICDTLPETVRGEGGFGSTGKN